MRWAWRFLVGAASLMFSAAAKEEPDILTRQPREPLSRFAARVIPKETELAHQPLAGRFGPGGAAGNILLLFRAANGVNTNYTGWVLTPTAPGKYRRSTLPAMREIAGHFEIAVEAVFYANADADPAPELFVLYSYHRNGSQDDDSRATSVYDWTGREFVSLEALEQEIAGFHTVAAIRAKLAKRARAGK